MPGKTHGERLDDFDEKINELSRSVATLSERVQYVSKQVDTVTSKQDDMIKDLTGFASRLAVVEHQVAELRKASEEGGRRLWSLLPALLGAIVGSIITLLGQMLLTRLGK